MQAQAGVEFHRRAMVRIADVFPRLSSLGVGLSPQPESRSGWARNVRLRPPCSASGNVKSGVAACVRAASPLGLQA